MIGTKRTAAVRSIRVTAVAIAIVVLFGPRYCAAAAGGHCPDPAHGTAAKAPSDLWPTIAEVFHIDSGAVHDAAFVRCVGEKLMACVVGANLDCGKADTRRALPGASAWCRQNPGSANIPMAATGHATTYQWSCKGRRAVAGRALVAVGRQGYIAANWKAVP